jgi:hypothetical protein
MLIQQEQAITMLARGDALMGNPVQQLARNGLCLSMGIGFLFGQDMPHSDQQFASDGDNRLLFADPPAQAFKLGLSMGMVLHRDPGSFDHHTTQITSAFFGDMFPLMGFPRVMHAGS